MNQTRLSIPRSRINLAIRDKERRSYSKYWEEEQKKFRISDNKKDYISFCILVLLSFFSGVLISFFELI
ncbi:hypothetical protein [Candidatus Liberibacter brunswickensis]|uniref:hypothetical protein n=1 Tax=Candidatus Liberibacter brunswickensis TaxID=1968796 RepID=UPI002FE23B4D